MTSATISALLSSVGMRVKWIAQGEPLLPEGAPSQVALSVLPAVENFRLDRFEQDLAARPAGSILLIPPLAPTRILANDLRESVKPYNLHEYLILSVGRQLRGDEFLAALVPRGSCSGRSSEQFRLEVAEAFDIPWIIEIDNAGALFAQVHASMKFSLLLLGLQTEVPVTRFFKLPSARAGNAVAEELKRLRKMAGGATRNGFVVRGRLTPGRLWTFDAYNPALEGQRASLGVIGNVVRLGDVASFPPTMNLVASASVLVEANTGSSDQPRVLEGRALLAGGTLSEDFRYRATSGPALQPGDIVVRAVVGGNGSLNPVVVEESMLPMVAGQSVIVIRPTPSLDQHDVELLSMFLASEAVRPFLLAAGVELSLHRAALADLPVPLADATLKEALRELKTAGMEIARWKAESDRAIKDIFSFVSVEDSRPRLLSTGRQLRLRVRVASALDQPEARIRTTYPHPIAFRWRSVEASSPDLDGYQQVLDTAEVVVCYLAQLSLMAASHSGVTINAAAQLRERLSRTGHGTSMGDWVAIYHELRTRAEFRQETTDNPFFELIRSVPVGSDTDVALNDLKRRRDDSAHQRGPRGGETSDAFHEAREALRILLIGLEFLSEYSLRYIERSRRDTLDGTTTIMYRDLMGDHPLVPLSESTLPVFDVEDGSLYIVDRRQRLHLMRPYVTRSECPKCHTWSTFYLDKVEAGRSTCQLKSMEHGHLITGADVSGLRRVGVL